MPKKENPQSLKVAFIHPDLGIGGAERLVVDAALSLQSLNNNKVTIYTSHCDRQHCFEEVKANELQVKVYGDWLPTDLLGKFKIIFAFLRQLYLCLKLIITGELNEFDLIILDQLPYSIPLLHYFKPRNAKILFYCHFPDKLLANHNSTIRKFYRYLFDKLEEISTSCSDKIIVNSKFTKSIVRKTFPMLLKEELSVLYPCVSSSLEIPESSIYEVDSFFKANNFFLSINRFERKKNISLAIRSFAKYINSPVSDKSQKLVVAGGYDPRVFENVSYLIELENLCKSLGLNSITIRGKLLLSPSNIQVYFLPSISTPLKNALISKCDLLMYTPSYEHFGIVPLEAMRLGKLVLADNTGGPLETIVNYFDNPDSFTGFTVDSSAVDNWFQVLKIVKGFSEVEASEIGNRCVERVDELFSFESMRRSLNDVVNGFETKVFHYELVIGNGLRHVVILTVVAIAMVFKWT